MANELVKVNVGDQVIARLNNLCETGFTMPVDYSYVNAIKASMLVLQDVKDMNGKAALEVCTQNSIQAALFDMCVKGLNVAKSQAYFVVRGNKLCLHESYFGKVLQVKRIFPNFAPRPVVIHEGDVFEYAIDSETGRKKLVKHEQKLENIDNDFIGAYLYVPCADGGKDLFVMTKKQIQTAWSKSSSKTQTVHKTFTEKMVEKTVVRSACTMLINSTPELAYATDEEKSEQKEAEFVEIEEVVDIEDTPIVPTPKQIKQQETADKNDNEPDF